MIEELSVLKKGESKTTSKDKMQQWCSMWLKYVAEPELRGHLKKILVLTIS